MRLKLNMLVLLIFLFGLINTSHASITYAYTSTPLVASSYGNNVGHIYSPLNVTLEFSNDGKELLDWSVSQPDSGALTMNEADIQYSLGLHHGQVFKFATDAVGNVTTWSISVLKILEPNTASNAHSVYFYANDTNSGHPAPGFNDGFSIYNYTPVPETQAISNTQGTWHTDNPIGNLYLDAVFNNNVSAVPEPETYAMLLAGLSLLGFIAHRRKNQQFNLNLDQSRTGA